MAKITVQLETELILKLIYLEITNRQLEVNLLNSFKNNEEVMSLLVNDKSSKLSFVENCIRHGQYEWVKELFKREDVKNLLKDELKNISIVDNIINLESSSVIKYLLELHGKVLTLNFYKENMERTNSLFVENLIDIIRTDVAVQEQKKYKKIFNALIKETYTPVIFTLLPMFKDAHDLIESSDLINWNSCDKAGNTIFHNLLNYDENLHPVIIKKMNDLNANDIKNNDDQTPLDKWLVFSRNKNNNLISLKDLKKLNYLLNLEIINWNNKDIALLNIIKRLLFTHARTLNNEELITIENIFTYVVRIPAIKNSKTQGYLNGVFNFSKKEGEQLNKIASIQRIFMQEDLKEKLIQSSTTVKKIKL